MKIYPALILKLTLILKASTSKHPVVIRVSDTDVLVFMCYTRQQLCPENDWLMKTDSERYVSVISIKLYFGENMCSVVPLYYRMGYNIISS